jgi:hypothetical protein
MKDTLRAGATAFGVAAGLLTLASTAQTTDGYIHASFGGPLDVFSNSTSAADVLAIGDGANDATELAALLKGPVGTVRAGAPNSPYRVAYEAGAAGVAPNAGAGTPSTTAALPTLDDPVTAIAAPTRKDAAILPSKPVVDSQGRIDCSGALSCHTDPATNTTTVTYPDGIVAIVQKVNDLTVVAYKTLTQLLPAEIAALLPPVPTATPPLVAAVTPAQVPAVAPTPVPDTTPTQVPTATPKIPVVESEPAITPSSPETSSAAINPGPPAPSVDLSPIDSGPKINVTTPSKDFSPGGSTDAGIGTGTGTSTPKIPALGKVKDAIGSVVDSVKGAVGSVLGPGASSKPDASDSSSTASQNSQSSNSSDNSKSDKSSGDGSG